MIDENFRGINYNLRPAKHVERKMLAEAFQRLRPFGSIESYRYVGFGAYYYRDFALFHKILGISDMLSIEHEDDPQSQKRFEFNKPYSCVRVVFGESNSVLPTLPWDVRTILWLDYDGGLNYGALSDLAHFCANACGGSVLVLTLNAHPERRNKSPLDRLRKEVGETAVPVDVTDADLSGWGKAKVYRRIVLNIINETLAARNGARAPGSKWLFKQLFNFHYRDNAMMVTVGGMLYDEGQAPLLGTCAFEDLPFVRTGEDPYKIQIPLLTYREIRRLDQQLPYAGAALDAPGVPEEDISDYGSIYRFFPNFTEVDIL